MRNSIIIGLILFSFWGQAQKTVDLSALVLDENKAFIEFGEAYLLIQDSLQVYSLIEDGSFEMKKLQRGKYHLVIQVLGYRPYERKLELNEDMILDIQLTSQEEIISEITVKAQRESISYENGNMSINLDNSIFATQASTVDMLAMLPGVLIDPTGESISLIGRGQPLLYIGNRSITLDELKAIPISNIKDITIVNNPSAKYEANGRSVILISLKRNRDNGLNWSIFNNVVQRRALNNYLGSSLNSKWNKIELRANINFNALQPWEGFDSELSVLNKQFEVKNSTVSFGQRPQWTGGLGLFYEINQADYISFNSTFRGQRGFFNIDNFSENNIDNNFLKGFSASDDLAKRSFYTSNINYNKKLSSLNANIFTGLQYSRYNRGLNNHISFGEEKDNLIHIQDRDQDYLVNVVAGKIDVEKKIFGKVDWESGTNLFTANSRALFLVQDLAQGTELNTEYNYSEKNLAFYSQASGSFKKTSYTIGIRSESTKFFGQFANEDTPIINRTQHNFFPRANFSLRIDSLQSLNINFSSSIFRPNYLNASSITTFISPQVEFSRNPNLVPSLAQFLSVNYQYNQQSLNVTTYRRNSVVQQSASFDEERGVIITSPENFDYEQGINFRINNYYTYKKYSLNNTTMLSFNQLVDERASIVQNAIPYLYLSSNHRISLPKDFMFALNFWMLTKRNSAVVERNAMYVLGSTITKQYKQWSFAINVTDLFQQMNYGERFAVNNISSNNLFHADGRSIGLRIGYTFERKFKSSFKNEDVDENLRRMN